MKWTKIVGVGLLMSMLTTPIFADEGMWVLKELNKQNLARMADLGFQVPEE